MIINCPNCGAPVRHLTGGDICEYCGSTFPIPNCRTVPSFIFQNCEIPTRSSYHYGSVLECSNIYSNSETQANLYSNAVNTITNYDKWKRFDLDAGVHFEWI